MTLRFGAWMPMWMVVSLKVTGNKREKVRGRGRKVQVAIYTELYMSYGTTGGDAGWATECTSLKFRGEARAGGIIRDSVFMFFSLGSEIGK